MSDEDLPFDCSRQSAGASGIRQSDVSDTILNKVRLPKSTFTESLSNISERVDKSSETVYGTQLNSRLAQDLKLG